MTIPTFALLMAAGQLTPGPDMLLILKSTLNHGLATALVTIAGICLGIILHLTLVFTGLAALIVGLPALFRSVQILGACYLLYLAWRLLCGLGQRMATPDFARRSLTFSEAFRQGLWTNLTNVKVLLLFSSILAPLAAGANGVQWIFGAVIILETALIWPLFAWLMQRSAIRHRFFQYQRGFNLLFAILIGGFATRLLLGI